MCKKEDCAKKASLNPYWEVEKNLCKNPALGPRHMLKTDLRGPLGSFLTRYGRSKEFGFGPFGPVLAKSLFESVLGGQKNLCKNPALGPRHRLKTDLRGPLGSFLTRYGRSKEFGFGPFGPVLAKSLFESVLGGQKNLCKNPAFRLRERSLGGRRSVLNSFLTRKK